MKILCYWYQHQSMYVKLGSTLSSKFQVTNSVRQRCVLSPLLFDVYVYDLSEPLNKSGIGGNMGGTIIIKCYMPVIYVLSLYLHQVYYS